MKRKTSLFSLILAATAALTFFLFGGAKQNPPVAAQIKKESATPARPEIVSREDWNAKPGVGEVKAQTLRAITIHHTATPQKKDVSIKKKMQNLQNFSQNEGRLATGKIKPAWFDVPYHFYIAADGKIAEGRELKFVGDTNTDYDPTGHALIVLEGNFENEQPSAAQLKSLEMLAAWLAAEYKIPAAEIKAHNDFAATACPGKNLKNLLPAIRTKIGEMLNPSKKN
ncbi:MAG TPA: peptidoglycan recognition family protein [Pyrinomonadaceae bacterium]|jgi:hypothetical protein